MVTRAIPQASDEEVAYLCRAVNRYLQKPLTPKDVVWRYAGIRPLYDDGTNNPSAVTRDYTLRVDDAQGAAAVLSVFGGKITTYRCLAEHVLDKLSPYFPGMKPAWTAGRALPGSELGTTPEAAYASLGAHYVGVPAEALSGIFRRHGMRAGQVLGDAKSEADLGEHFGAGLYAREVAYLVEHEWAKTAEDVLWRRTKAGLHLSTAQQDRVAAWLAAR